MLKQCLVACLVLMTVVLRAGADSLKTGYTNASGFNLVMSAMRDNRRLIGVVMGGSSAFARDLPGSSLRGCAFAASVSPSALRARPRRLKL